MMFLARRERGKALRVYPVKTHEAAPRVWLFRPTIGESAPPSDRKSFLCEPGVAALARTATLATTTLTMAEDDLFQELAQ